jgi:hypothetical protein
MMTLTMRSAMSIGLTKSFALSLDFVARLRGHTADCAAGAESLGNEVNTNPDDTTAIATSQHAVAAADEDDVQCFISRICWARSRASMERA